MFKLLTGRRLMLAVLSKIESLVAHLERAMKHIEEEIDNNDAEIDRLHSENSILHDHRERANRVTTKFRDLIA